MGSRPSRDQDPGYSALRLTLALLGYFIGVTLVVTLSPFDFGRRSFQLMTRVHPIDVALNVALFLPLGFLLRSLGATRRRFGWSAVLVAFAFSTAIETAQIFIPDRRAGGLRHAARAHPGSGRAARPRPDTGRGGR